MSQARQSPYGTTHFNSSFWFSADPVSKKLYLKLRCPREDVWQLSNTEGGWTYEDMFDTCYRDYIHTISSMTRGGKRYE